jgi:hypothetical protein
VSKPDLYDPKLNRAYAELAEHYGVLIDPARVRKPRDKALPARPSELASWTSPKVGPDIHVRVGRALYSVPWRLIGERVDARQSWNLVQIFHKGDLVATHVRVERGRQKDDLHYPPEKIAFRMRTPVWCRRRAGELGPNVTTVVGDLLAVDTLNHLRSAQGVLGLADKHGPARLDAACAKAIAVGDPSYRTIRGILAVGAEADPPPPPTRDGGAAAHLHGPWQLFGAVVPTSTTPEPPAMDPAATSPTFDVDPVNHDRHHRPGPTHRERHRHRPVHRQRAAHQRRLTDIQRRDPVDDLLMVLRLLQQRRPPPA